MCKSAIRNLFSPQSCDFPPALSLIIPVHDDWAALEKCLTSLSNQIGGPFFEVVVVDDGSVFAAPCSLRHGNLRYSIKLIRQFHAGIAVARNAGLHAAAGAIILFLDCDCVLNQDCLASLMRATAVWPEKGFFQLHLVGDCISLVGKTEHLHLSTIQHNFVSEDGHIRFLAGGAFAVRRTFIPKDNALFDSKVIRAQDTLLLSQLILLGQLPIFVPDAFVVHAVGLPLHRYLVKALRTGFLEGRAYRMINSCGTRIRINNRKRLRMLMESWNNSSSNCAEIVIFCLLVVRQTLKLTGFAVYSILQLVFKRRIYGLQVAREEIKSR